MIENSSRDELPLRTLSIVVATLCQSEAIAMVSFWKEVRSFLEYNGWIGFRVSGLNMFRRDLIPLKNGWLLVS